MCNPRRPHDPWPADAFGSLRTRSLSCSGVSSGQSPVFHQGREVRKILREAKSGCPCAHLPTLRHTARKVCENSVPRSCISAFSYRHSHQLGPYASTLAREVGTRYHPTRKRATPESRSRWDQEGSRRDAASRWNSKWLAIVIPKCIGNKPRHLIALSGSLSKKRVRVFTEWAGKIGTGGSLLLRGRC